MDGSCHCGGGARRSRDPDMAPSATAAICRRQRALWAEGFEGEAFTVSGRKNRTYVGSRAARVSLLRPAPVVAWLTTSRGRDGRYMVR